MDIFSNAELSRLTELADELEEEVEGTFDFELYVNDQLEASCSGHHDAALAEIMHCYQQYKNDGEVKIYRVMRVELEFP